MVKFRTKQKHMIDLIFPVALFFVFALCAVTVLLLAARIYQSTTENSSLNYNARTGLSYISEKIHQNDVGGNVDIADLDGTPALVMKQQLNDELYYTYIYSHEQELKELFIKQGAEADLSAGTKILEIRDFSMKEVEENLFSFSCVDKNGQESSIIVSIKSN